MGEYDVPENVPTNWRIRDSDNLSMAKGLLTGILIVSILSFLLGLVALIGAKHEVERAHKELDKASKEIVVKHVWVKRDPPPTR